jgi:hypothetical protein
MQEGVEEEKRVERGVEEDRRRSDVQRLMSPKREPLGGLLCAVMADPWTAALSSYPASNLLYPMNS